MKNNKRFLLGAISAFACFQLFAQTPGMIFEPATGPGQAVLDPNADGYVSSTTGGFIANDQTESEIPYVPMVFPGLEPTSDLGPGPNCGFTDFVDSGTEDPAMIYYDGINLIFRMRMGNALPNSKGYSVLVDTDQLFGLSGPNADPNATQNNPGFEIEINLQTNFGVFVYPVDGACATVPSSSFPGHTNYSKAIALTTNCANPDYFYDFYVPFSSLSALGITLATPLRMAIITQMNPQPAICNNALSDFGGIDDNTCGSNPWDCWTEIIENYPPTPVGNVNVPAPDMSVCPFINTPIMNGATVVSGTSSHVNGTVITVYKNAVSIGTAIVGSNAWSLTGITPALAGGDIITATAQAPLRTVSTSNCNPRTVAATCTAPLVNGLVSGNAKAVCGAAGAGIPGASVLVYDQNGNLVNNNLVTTVAPDGSFLWKCNATTANCNSGPNCLSNGAYYVTQTFGTECESVGIWICVGNSTPTTAVPTITTPVLSTGNFVSGTSAANATIYVWSGSVLVGTTIATAGGAWTLTPVSLTLGQSLTAQAIVTGSCASALTAPVIVSRNTVAPIITGTYCTVGPITSVTGTSTEAVGTVIQVYRNAIAHGSTTTVNISGNWTANVGISISPGDVITARATATGCAQSVPSNSITVGNQTTSSVTITTSPIIEGASSISGTGSNGNLITLYVDGYPEGTTTVSGGVWTVSGLNQFTIYATGLVTATATSPGNCPGAATAPIVVQCIMPNISLQVNATDTSVCGTTVTPVITVVNSQAGIVYQLFNGASPTGSSILGTGANITLTPAPITVSTTLTVRAIKIGMPGCISTLTDAVLVFVNPNPSATLTVTPASGAVCQNGSTTINVALSQSGFSYQLKNLATNANVGTAVAGTGGTINLPTGTLTATTSYYIIVTGAAPTLCSDTLNNQATVTVTPVTTSNAGADSTLNCANNSLPLTANTPSAGTGAWTIISGTGGSFANAAVPTTTFTGTTGQTYVLRWTITNASCSSFDEVTIVIPAPPTTSNAGTNQTLACGVTTTNLTANSAVSGTGLWSIVSGIGGSVATPSSESSSFTGVAGQTYVLSWTITNGTCSSSSNVTVIVPANPTTSNAGSNQTLACGATTTNLTANTAVSGTGLWSIVSGIGGSVATPSSESSSFTGVAGQTYVLSWTITNGPCSSSSNVTVIVPANPTTSNAGSNQTLACGVTTTNLTANTAVSGTGLWSIVSGIGGSVATPSSESSSFTGVAGQTYVLSWTITNGPCSSSSNVTVIVPANPTTSNAGSNQTLACGVTSTNLTANTAVSGTGLWSIVSGIGGSVATPSSESSSFTGVAGQTYVLSWTITNGPCSSSSNVTVIVPANPTTSNAGSNQTVPCGTSSINLTANTPSSGTGSWTILSGSGGSISNSALPNSSFSGTAGQTYLLTWTITAGVCASVDSVTIAFDATPTTASVGATQTLPCGIVSTNLSGNTALIGNGIWTILSGSGGSVSNPSSESSLFTGIAGQTYQLQWTISSGACSTSATLTVVVPPSSVTISNAGTDQTGAAMCGVTSTILAANTPTTGTGSWSIFSGAGGSFGNALLPNTTFTGLAGQAYQLLWTISDASCTSVDTVNVTFYAAPTVSNAGSNQTLSCGATSTALAANAAITGIGTWTILSGTGGSLVNANDENSIFNGNVGETYVLEWTIANGPCTSTSTVTITLPTLPTAANAGTNQTLACGVLSTTLTGNTISSGTGTWTILSGTGGSLANATSESSGFTGIAGQTYLIAWTSSTASCTSIDSVTITLPQLPTTSSAGTDQTLACGTTNTTLNANTAFSGSGNWTIVSGTGGSFGNASSETSTFSGTAGETYVLTWTITIGACSSMDSVTVFIPALPTTSNAGSNQTLTCGDVTAVLSANVPVTGTGMWTITSGIGGSFNNANSDTATFTGNPGETYVLTWTITSGPCSSSSNVTIIVPVSSVTISNAGTDQTGVAMCGVTSTILTANTASAGTGSWIILSGNGGVLANASSPTSGFTGVAGETYVLQWFITDGNCNSMDDVIVDFPEIPTTSVAGADDTLSCGITSTTLAANAPVIGLGTWSVVSGIGGSFANANSDTSAFTGTAGESYVLVWTIANGPCESNDTVNVIMPATPTVASAGPDQTLNCGDVTAALAGNVAVSGTGTWSIITGIGGSINSPSVENAILMGVPAETYVLTWTITTGLCSTIDTVTVVIPPSTVTISNAGPDQSGASMCGVTNTLLSANLAAMGTGYWTIISGTGGVFADSSLAASAFTGIAGQTYTLQWMISDTVCASSDDVIIAFAELPTTANAGVDDTLICGVTVTVLSATPTTIGTGMWTIVSGTGGNLVDADSAASGFTGTQGETYILVWTTTNGPCTSTDTLSVFMPAALTAANAGADQTLACGDLTAVLAADSALSGTGMWNVISGNGGSINSPTDENAILTGIANETYILTWTVTSGPCSSIDTVTIVIPANAVTVSNAGLDQTGSALCGMTSTTLEANIATQGTGSWIIVSGTGGSFVDAADPNTTFTGVAGQTYTLQWVITDAACSSTDDVIISFPVLASTADAGNDAFLPCTALASTLSANLPANGSGMWSQLSGPAANISTPTSPNTPINGLTPGSYAFVWTISNAPCPASADTVYLEVLTCDSGLIIPSGFSPNGDGTNDYFELVGISAYPDNKVTIFNRWGTLIYESAGYDNGAVRWEGNNSGELSIGSGPVPEATYFYVIDLGDGSKLLSGYEFLNRQ